MRLVLSLLILAAIPAELAAQRHAKARLDSLEARARADSLDSELQYLLGNQYRVLERYDDAEQALRKAVAIEPRHAAAYLALSGLTYARHPKLRRKERDGKVPPELAAQAAEARRHYRLAFMLDPFAQFSPFDLMIINWITADSVTDKQRAKLPPEFFWLRGIARANKHEWDAALADLQETIDRLMKLQEGSRTDELPLAANDVRYVMAVVEWKAGRRHKATERLQEVLTHDVGMYWAHVMLADIHEWNTAFRAAVLERRRAMEVNPDDPSLVYDLGASLARAGELHAADTALARAMELNPRNPRVPRMLGLVRHELGDTAGARRAYERFLAIAPASYAKPVKEVRTRLASLK